MTRNTIDGGRHPKRRDSQATWAKLKSLTGNESE
jgi:hypothetical protein